MAIFWRSCPCSKSQGSISQANNDAGEARDVEHRSHPYRFPVLEVPTALLGDHYRHRFDLGRCFEAWVPSTCSINVPHGLRDPCWKWSELHRGERLGSSSRSIRAIGTPWGSGGGLEEAFSDFLGHHANLVEEHRKSVYLVPFFFKWAGRECSQ